VTNFFAHLVNNGDFFEQMQKELIVFPNIAKLMIVIITCVQKVMTKYTLRDKRTQIRLLLGCDYTNFFVLALENKCIRTKECCLRM